MGGFHRYLEKLTPEIEQTLERVLPSASREPARLHEAMRYCVLGGGKRIRPALAVLAGEACGANRAELLVPASALELIHTFSLVHDDLPALDDDDVRRGQPTVHRKYDEALAIMVGDALLNLGLQTLAEAPSSLAPEGRLRNLQQVATAVGSLGMIGGQVDDLAAEGGAMLKAGGPDRKTLLEHIHRRKTGALLVASVHVGVNCARYARTQDHELPEVEGPQRSPPAAGVEATLLELAEMLGLMFQIRDDILDIEGDSAELGKTAGKDEAVGKLTYPGLYGLSRSKAMLIEQRDRGLDLASRLPEKRELFVALLEYLAQRSR